MISRPAGPDQQARLKRVAQLTETTVRRHIDVDAATANRWGETCLGDVRRVGTREGILRWRDVGALCLKCGEFWSNPSR
jgi:hypothetical protein